ncbi:MAG: MFS transporter [Candidatus Parvarchaeota archaeon]|nr:MFS transporter [Candidatus Parvarchaeota archaeon]
MEKWFVNKNVLYLSLSAFFADAGYQAVIALFPVFLVLFLKAPVYYLGIIYALQYGIGAIFAYLGGVLADRYSKKKVAIIGNSLIPILSFLGIASSLLLSPLLFLVGWWARDSRSPARRALVTLASDEKHRKKAFGVLHALDLGGGAVGIVYLIILLYLGVAYSILFLVTIIPLVISTLFIIKSNVKEGLKAVSNKLLSSRKKAINKETMLGVFIATSLFGFSYYSLGYPILTIAQRSNDILGVFSYLIFLLISAFAGYYLGSRAGKLKIISSLSLLGYALAGIGSLLIGIFYIFSLNIGVAYLGVLVLGFAVGAIETFEPTIISFTSTKEKSAKSFGYLSSSRSIGLFTGNLLMGILYFFSPFYSYIYAFAVSMAAALIVYIFGRKLILK